MKWDMNDLAGVVLILSVIGAVVLAIFDKDPAIMLLPGAVAAVTLFFTHVKN